MRGLTLADRRLRVAELLADGADNLRAPAFRRALARRNLRSAEAVTGDAPVIVSLTTFGHRLADVHLVIESIGAGRVRPARLILWVDDEATAAEPPEELRRLVARGLEVRATRDLGPYKKFYPALAERTAGQYLATADDDVLYPRHWLERLLAAALAEPELVHCYRARVIQFEGEGLAPYDSWPKCYSAEASRVHFPTGVSGVIYPPRLLGALQDAGDAFLATAPRSDDVWLHYTAVTNGYRIRQLSAAPRHFPWIPGSQTVALFSTNQHQGGNDPQLRATHTAKSLALIREDS